MINSRCLAEQLSKKLQQPGTGFNQSFFVGTGSLVIVGLALVDVVAGDVHRVAQSQSHEELLQLSTVAHLIDGIG